MDKIFAESVMELAKKGLLDCSVLHGDGSLSMAKKGGDNIGYGSTKILNK
ncbi:MAG: hypothetical protein GY821_07400 [Gammaproteobacteria bacterium]|nr:hypothetical protein [Gammaproteobacteria bacterium]